VIQDPKLFRVLLRCLQSASVPAAETYSGERGAAFSSVPNAQRKRSLSLSVDADQGPSKALKLAHSPVPSARHKMHDSNKQKPSFNVQVLAATILYTAFQHLDHWPVPLVRAYAEDCFGPRSWVDDERCRLLVANLKLVHEEDSGLTSPTNPGDAQKVAEAYRKFESKPFEEEEDSSSPLLRRGSNFSAGSSAKRLRSMSIDSFQFESNSSIALDDDDSDSGEEEEVINTAVSDSVKDDDGNSSSSGEEDEEVLVTTKSNDGESPDTLPVSKKFSKGPLNRSRSNGSDGVTEGKAPTLDGIYPIAQFKLNLEKVRQRFWGLNLEYAYDCVSSSLIDRLDIKSKQNSGLLQTLPSFTAIPAVRRLIADNLERWLQSPALAGLARALFSATVSQMRNVDPPLIEDLRALDSILGMKLKANQVRSCLTYVWLVFELSSTDNGFLSFFLS